MDDVSLVILFIGFLVLAAGVLILFFAIRQRAVNQRAFDTYEAVVEKSGNPVFIINHGGKILYVNSAFASWIGVEQRELIGKSIFLYTSYVQQEPIENALREGKSWAGLIRQKKLNGTSTGAYLLLEPLIGADGSLSSFIGLHLDVERHSINIGDGEFKETVRRLPDGVVVLQDERIVFANTAALNVLGFDTLEEVSRVHYTSIVPPQIRSFFQDIYTNGVEKGESVHNYDMQCVTKNSDIIDLEVNSAPIEWDGHAAVLLSLRDVRERKRTEREQAQWLWEQELLNTIERQLVSTVDLSRVLDMIVYHARLLVRADFSGVLTIDPDTETYRWLSMRGNTEHFPRDFLSLGPAAKEFFHESEYRIINQLGTDAKYPKEEFPFLASEGIVTVIQFPLMRGSIVFGHLVIGYRNEYDPSDRILKLIQSFMERATVAIMNAELYDQLRQQTRNLQQLFETRMQVQEEERRRIASELHDSLGQLLTSIKIHTEVLLDSELFANTKEREQMDEIRMLLDQAIVEARNISYDLRPSILDDFGLVPALEVLCEKFSSRTGLKVSFQAHNFGARLNPQLETALYRIAQEALHNVQKHSAATEVSVQIIRTPKTINLVIEDNGKGFDPKKIEQMRSVSIDGKGASGMGLVSMAERAKSFNGTCTVDSTPGKGTDIVVEIPLCGVTEDANDTSDIS